MTGHHFGNRAIKLIIATLFQQTSQIAVGEHSCQLALFVDQHDCAGSPTRPRKADEHLTNRGGIRCDTDLFDRPHDIFDTRQPTSETSPGMKGGKL